MMKEIGMAAAGVTALYSAWYAAKAATVSLRHFQPSEFGLWWPFMSTDLLERLDAFRAAWGHPVQISPAPGALGRVAGAGEAGNASQHNVIRWGEVRAVDAFPTVIEDGRRRGATKGEMQLAVEIARTVGFRGIGVYPDTKPYPMMHLDVRPADRVATWSRIDGQYLALSEAWTGRGWA